jgi:hypothetical protein
MKEVEKEELKQPEEKNIKTLQIIDFNDLEYLFKIKLKCLNLAVKSCKSIDGLRGLNQAKEYFAWLRKIE